MYATVHLVVGCIKRKRLHVGLQNGCRLGENRNKIAAAQKVEDDVHAVHLNHDAIVQLLALYKMVEGVARLQTLARQYEVVALKVGKSQRRLARKRMVLVDDSRQAVAEYGSAFCILLR